MAPVQDAPSLSTHLTASAPFLSWHAPSMLQEWSHLLQEALPDGPSTAALTAHCSLIPYLWDTSKCSLQYEEPRVWPTTTSLTESEHAELPTTLQHEAYACTLLLALCLLLSWEKSHRSTTKNMPRPGRTDDSPTRVGEHTPRLTSLFSTPTPFFPVPESPS